jgi:hypothetical protein
MKYTNLFVLIGTVLFLAACGQRSLDGEPSLSDLRFDRLDHDLGEVYQQHTYDLEYPFEAVGSDPITIAEIDVSCGCTNASIYPAWDTATYGDVWPLNEPIPGGAKGFVRATFDGSRYKRDKSATITLRGNFLERKATLGVKAFVKPVFDVQPQNINFGEVITSTLASNPPERLITVTAMKDYAIDRWIRVPKGLLIEEVGEVKKLDGGQVSRQYRITINSNISQGPMSSSVDAETTIGINLTFTVAARVLGPVRYSPAQRVAFGIYDAGQRKHRTVKLEATRGAPNLPMPTVEIVGGAKDAIVVEVITAINDGTGYQIKMVIAETVPPGNYNGLLKISYPDNPDYESQEIRVNARIRKK